MKKVIAYPVIFVLILLGLNGLGRLPTDIAGSYFALKGYQFTHPEGTERLFTDYGLGPIQGNSDHFGPCFMYYRELRLMSENERFEDIQAYYRAVRGNKFDVTALPISSVWVMRDFSSPQEVEKILSKKKDRAYFFLYTSPAIPMIGLDKRCILI